MRERIEGVRAALKAIHCDAFVSFFPAANQYLSGFRASASAIAITMEKALFLCDFRYTEHARQLVQDFEVCEVTGALETRLGERLREFRIGQPAFDPSVMTVRQATLFTEALGSNLVPAPTLLSRMREVKTPDEIRRIRAASELAEDALLALLPVFKPGVTEREWAARLEYEFKCRGASDASFSPIVLFGSRSSLPHGRPSDKPLEIGDIILIDCGCILDGYCSDLTRTYVFGKIPGEWFQDVYSAVLAAQEAGLGAVKPGVACAEADAIARKRIQDAGFGEFFGHGLGHGVGIEVHEAPRLNKESTAVLQTGMVVTVEPGIYLPGQGGVRIEDLAVVTEQGCAVLTRAPKKLEVLTT